jgi:chemotaxis response regulator CheB
LSPRVVVVDDSDLMRTLLRGILRDNEYQVVGEAKNGSAHSNSPNACGLTSSAWT